MPVEYLPIKPCKTLEEIYHPFSVDIIVVAKLFMVLLNLKAGYSAFAIDCANLIKACYPPAPA